MQMKHLLLKCLLLISFCSYGQKKPYYNQRTEFLNGNKHWVMPGDSAGLTFNSGGPLATRTSMTTMEGGAAVSDPITGKLLFYSNGETCWDANGVMMPNGDSLLGNSRYSNRGNQKIGFGSTCQGVSIIPVLAEPGKYYLFSLLGKTGLPDYSRGSLFYSVIDMNLNNGLGDIEGGRKNIPLCSDTLSEMMVAIPGGNCGDIWLLVHGFGKEDFLAFHITQNGVDTVPVKSTVVTSLSAMGPILNLMGYFQGYMTKSPDRKKLAVSANAVFFIAEFDPKTGTVSKPIEIPAAGQGREPCFSPDNSKLYYNNVDSILQFDISVYDSLAINSSMRGIAANNYFDSSSFQFGNSVANMRLYNDSIYLWFYDNNKPVPYQYISRINQPNLNGKACAFEQKAIPILQGTMIDNGFGSEVVFPIFSDTFYNKVLDTTVCTGALVLTPSAVYENILWQDGSYVNTRTITAAGLYWVLQSDGCDVYMDTFNVAFFEALDPVVNVSGMRLGTTRKYRTYQWLFNGAPIPNATDSIFQVQKGGNGQYQVIVTDEHCTDTSDIYVVNNANDGTGIDNDRSAKDQIRLYPNPTKDMVYISSTTLVNICVTSIDGKVVKQEEQVTAFSVADLADGIYILHVTDDNRHRTTIKFTKTK